MVRPRSRVAKVDVVGPLAPFADDFRSMLEASGYTPLSIVNQLRLMAHLSRWMEAGHYSVVDLSGELLEDYLTAARAAGRVSLCSQGGLVHLLRVLPIAPVIPERAAVSAAGELLASFRRHLLHERGLAQSTAAAYVLRAGRFLAWVTADGNVTGLTAGYVTGAVLRESQNVSVGSAQFFVAALRSFLRFCFVEGYCQQTCPRRRLLSPAADDRPCHAGSARRTPVLCWVRATGDRRPAAGTTPSS